MKDKYLWYTDNHLDKVSIRNKSKFAKYLNQENPKGIFLTGDISNGKQTISDLEIISDNISCPIYFVLGNHDYYGSSIEKTHDSIQKLCQKRPNLIWMTEAGVIHLNEEVALIGSEGWYDAEEGKPEYLKLTFDWFSIENFKRLPDMAARIKVWRKMAKQSQDQIEDLLEKAIEQKYKTVYILTHFPPWKEATRDQGTLLEKFWLPYNCNLHLGRGIEKVMVEHKKKHAIILCGHTHTPLSIRVSRNIECMVGSAHTFNKNKSDQNILLI